MNRFRAILIGAVVWLFVFTAFALLGYVPAVKDSLNLQAAIVGLLIIPFALAGAIFYYKNSKGHGLIVGLVMVGTALLLDALITVPLVEIPGGGSYLHFYLYPPLWLLVIINVATVYFYWRLKYRQD